MITYERNKEYDMIHSNGQIDSGWKVVYYPLLGTWKPTGLIDGGEVVNEWIDFDEPRALVEKRTLINGTRKCDFREIPLRYLKK